MRAAALLCLLGCTSARAQETFWKQAAGSLSSTAIRAHVDFLTDDLLEGRRAGSRGEALSARYIATQLLADGFAVQAKPATLPVATVVETSLTATRGNVTVELKPGVDFVLRRAPRSAHLESATPELERESEADWPHVGPPLRAAHLVPLHEGSPVLAIAPAAAAQVEGATLAFRATLDLAPVVATDVVARMDGADKCEVTVSEHHDSFGPGFQGAADDAAGVAVLLEAARGLALARKRPQCTVVLISRGGGEWTEPHAPTGHAHTVHDRIARDWNWEDLKKRAQELLTRLGEGRR